LRKELTWYLYHVHAHVEDLHPSSSLSALGSLASAYYALIMMARIHGSLSDPEHTSDVNRVDVAPLQLGVYLSQTSVEQAGVIQRHLGVISQRSRSLY
jgi:hypothetical protein